MSTKKTIWAVSSGEYSDYGVEAVFATKELAEEYIRVFTENTSRIGYNEDRRVEEFTFYDQLPDYRVVLIAQQTIGAGAGLYAERTEISWEGERPVKAHLYEHPDWSRNGGGLAIDVRVEGTDHERVRKAFSERLAHANADPRVGGNG